LVRGGIPDVTETRAGLVIRCRGLATPICIAKRSGRRVGALVWGRREPLRVRAAVLHLLGIVVAEDTCDVAIIFGFAIGLVALAEGGVAGFRRGEDVREV
jgi:hypothetical protein